MTKNELHIYELSEWPKKYKVIINLICPIIGYWLHLNNEINLKLNEITIDVDNAVQIGRIFASNEINEKIDNLFTLIMIAKFIE